MRKDFLEFLFIHKCWKKSSQFHPVLWHNLRTTPLQQLHFSSHARTDSEKHIKIFARNNSTSHTKQDEAKKIPATYFVKRESRREWGCEVRGSGWYYEPRWIQGKEKKDNERRKMWIILWLWLENWQKYHLDVAPWRCCRAILTEIML